jgi:VWFA-related protein
MAGWFSRSACLAVLFALVLLCVPILLAQQEPKITVEVKVVTVYATVQDKQGKVVSDLPQSAFSLEEDGRPQTIRYFERESGLPLTLGLLVDTSLSQRRVLGQERSASDAFLIHLLRQDKDKAFIIHFDHEVELLQDLTASRTKLEDALDLLEVSQPGQSGSTSGGQSRRGGSRGAGTLLYDAIYLASNEVTAKQQGRKALILLTDGADRGSKETLERAVESAQRADTMVYSIFFQGEEGYPQGGSYGGWGGRRGGRYPQQDRPDGKKVLDRISKETGGRMFEVTKKHAVDDIYDEIEKELRSQYSLGYTPDRADLGPGFHKIRVTTNQKGLTVEARDGYYYQP